MNPIWCPGLYTWRPLRRSHHLCSPATSHRDWQLVCLLGALSKASHIAPSGVPPVLAQLCSLNSFFICSISGNSRATALQVLSFLRLLLSQPLSSNCSFRFLMCNCTLTFTCVPLHYRFVYIFLWANAFFSLCQCTFHVNT